VLAVLIALLLSTLTTTGSHGQTQSSNQLLTNASALDLIYRQRYNDAITRLEEILEREPGNSEAITYLATANLYQTLDFMKAQKEFEDSFKTGGGATFFVTHAHEALATGDVVDYCRGWLHLRHNRIQYVPLDGTHALDLTYSQVQEFKRNKVTKRSFHIKVDGKNQNFRGRSNSDTEALLIVALYNSFARNSGVTP
jgi:tetratricopeptide (TPR) repeat protein